MKPIIRLFLSAVFSVCLLFGFSNNLKANVGPDGSFNYSVPIELPQGTAGCAPQLALVYNSNAGNGMLGQGWDLAGLGAITRDTTHPINYNGSDYFVGPGGRLVLITTGSLSGDYHYENESFCRIELNGTIGESGSYWLETKPDGTKYYYGSTSDSKIAAIGKGNQLRAWALSKVEDLHGNYYSIEYSQDTSGEYYPTKITYTENLGFPISDDRSVEFGYQNRSDYYPSYAFGCSVQTQKRLQYIYVKLDGTTSRTYTLYYDNGGTVGGTRLTSVADSGSADGELDLTWEQSNGDGTFDISNPAIMSGSVNLSSAWINPASSKIITADFNGDGKTDFLIKNSAWSSNPIFLSKGDGTFDISNPAIMSGSVNLSSAWVNPDSSELITADFNGDGKTDFLIKNSAWSSNPIFLSKGDGTFDITNPSIFCESSNASSWLNSPGTQIITGDFNGDGKTDFILYNSTSGYNWATNPIFLSNGNGTFTVTNPSIFCESTNASSWLNSPGTQIITGDFNGDGKTDFILQNISLNWPTTPIFLSNSKSSLLTSIQPPLGTTTTIDYKPAPQFADTITIDDSVFGQDKAVDPTTSSGQYIANSSPRNLVASVTTTDGRTGGGSYTTSYSYDNGKIYTGYPYQRKDLFFECVTERTGTGPYTKTYYKINDQNLAGKIDKVEGYDQNNNLMKKTQYAYTYSTPNTGITWVRPTSITENTYETGAANLVFTRTTTFDSYDIYGNAKQVTESASGLNNIITQTTYSTDSAAINAWIISRPIEIKQYRDSTSGAVLKWQQFTYNANNELETKKDWAGGSKWIITSFTYDSWGNVASITAPNAIGTTSTTYIFYDANYQTFPERVVNYKGGVAYEIQTHYNPANGNKLYVTDFNGNTTNYIYDNFGRLTDIIEPGVGWTKKMSYQNWGNPNTQYVETQMRDSSTEGYYFEREYFDGLKRKYKTVAEGYESFNKITTYEYDPLGRLYKQSNPYMEGCGDSTKYYTTFEYDAAGRISKKIYPDGAYDTISYPFETGTNRQVVKLVDRKNSTHYSRYDSRSKLRNRTDTGIAYMSYSYDTLGRLITTSGSDGKLTTIAYDTLGRKTSIIDPNTGTTSYTYSDSGHVQTQTDARGITLTYGYDELNRLISESSSDGTVSTQYYFDMSVVPNSKGRLSKVADNSGETIFSYDERGNVTGYIKSIDDNHDGIMDQDFAVAMQYDWQKRVSALTYPDPDHTVVRNHYADAGYLKAVTDINDNAYVQYARESCSINSIQRRTGNGVITTIGYNPANLRPVSIKTVHGTSTLEDLTYTHDNIGNITNITDNYPTDPQDYSINDTETFTYDNINRLTKAVSAGLYGTANYAFSANGNLTSKEGLGLTYGDSAHPYAVTSYDGKSYGYDAAGNMTSRIGKTLVYDAKNRLIEIKSGTGTTEEKYTYDYAGFRVKKEFADGTKVYNVNGLHELRIVPGQAAMSYTNYIYGMSGDLVAQIAGTTTTGASIYPIAKDMYNWKDLKGLFLKLHAAANAFVENPKNIRALNIAFMMLAVLGCLCIFIYTVFFRKRHTILIPRWMAHAIPMLLIVFFASFGFTGCFELFPNGVVEGVYYFHPNHNGSVKMITKTENDVFTIVARYKYKPYGEMLSDKSSGSEVSKYKYTSQEEDNSTSLYYYNARYYDPACGRFITADSIVPNLENTQDFNRYMYVRGNPVNNNDPSGHATDVPEIDNELNTDEGHTNKGTVTFNSDGHEETVFGIHSKPSRSKHKYHNDNKFLTWDWGETIGHHIWESGKYWGGKISYAILGEDSALMEFCDRTWGHPVAVLHDNWLANYDKWTGHKVLHWARTDTKFGQVVYLIFFIGSMYYAYYAGTIIAAYNAAAWMVNKAYSFGRNHINSGISSIINTMSWSCRPVTGTMKIYEKAKKLKKKLHL
ncbi:MAG: FG-GAP-like repeat-containing protein [Spirochaetota bacterium]